MTACFKMMKALHHYPSPKPDTFCTSCVYHGNNLDMVEYPVLREAAGLCGLGFIPGDDGCLDMRTDNCSMRKR